MQSKIQLCLHPGCKVKPKLISNLNESELHTNEDHVPRGLNWIKDGLGPDVFFGKSKEQIISEINQAAKQIHQNFERKLQSFVTSLVRQSNQVNSAYASVGAKDAVIMAILKGDMEQLKRNILKIEEKGGDLSFVLEKKKGKDVPKTEKKDEKKEEKKDSKKEEKKDDKKEEKKDDKKEEKKDDKKDSKKEDEKKADKKDEKKEDKPNQDAKKEKANSTHIQQIYQSLEKFGKDVEALGSFLELSQLKQVVTPVPAPSQEWDESTKSQCNEKLSAIKKNFTVRYDPKRKMSVQATKGITAAEIQKCLLITAEFSPLVLSLVFRSAGMQNLKGFESISNHKNLQQLDLDFYDNQLVDISELMEINKLLNLSSLSIEMGKNQIGDLKVFAELRTLPKLQTLSLDLRNNFFSDVKAIKALKKLPQLKNVEIWLQENKSAAYPNHIGSLQELLAAFP